VEATEILATTSVEDRHWWYRERRAILARELRRMDRPGRAIEIGAAGGGNSLVLQEHGWEVLATEYLEAGVEIARSRGLSAIQADARSLPVESASRDLLVAFDVLEHIDEDHLAAAEVHRVLRPGGTALIAVPCDMRLWSEHDVISGHYRRYTRQSLTALIEDAGLRIEELWSWNVLLRPAVALRRGGSGAVTPKQRGGPPDGESPGTAGQAAGLHDVTDVHPLVNAALGAIVRLERRLPVRSLPGVSLMLRATRPEQPLDAQSGSS